MKRKLLHLCVIVVFLLSCMSTVIQPTDQQARTAYKHAYNAPDTNPTITPALVVPVHLLETGGTGKIEMEMTK